MVQGRFLEHYDTPPRWKMIGNRMLRSRAKDAKAASDVHYATGIPTQKHSSFHSNAAAACTATNMHMHSMLCW